MHANGACRGNDDNNIKGAMKLLDEIAKNYQVIYFTCSESRIHN